MSEKNNDIKRVRCPKGTRKNQITKKCEPTHDKNIPEEKSTFQRDSPPPSLTRVTFKKKRFRCPKGTRKNPITNNCEPTHDTNIPKILPESSLKTESSLKAESSLKELTPESSLKEITPELSLKEITPELSLKELTPESSLKELTPESSLEEINPNIEKDEINETLVNIPPSSNDFIFKKEKIQHNEYKNAGLNDIMYRFLYPDLNDPNFNIKIAKRNEFYTTKLDGTIYDIRKQSNILCNAKFELSSHQLFVKNFFSFQTPYNSLLLYHGLGTGKTCSAIGIAEEMRTYMKQIGIKQRIIVVASPNVQSNFRLQLFDERKLNKINNLNNESNENIWNIESCIGNDLIKEINPTNLKGLSREKVITLINTIINNNYLFIGYNKIANHIMSKINTNEDSGFTEKEQKQMEIRNIRRYFNNRLFIIDEVHNIRIADDNNKTKIASLLMKLAKYTDNMRLLLMSATPMFNSYKEIIWITNLLNQNDKRSVIQETDVFDKSGSFKLRNNKIIESEDGRELLRRKLTGYISYVRGENPYLFPFRIYPIMFSKQNTFIQNAYPTIQMNNKPITEPIRHLQLYLNNIGEYQYYGYNTIIKNLRTKSFNNYNVTGKEREMPSFENMESFGYIILQTPIEALNIVYPNERFDNLILSQNVDNPNPIDIIVNKENEPEIISTIVGKKGLLSIMNFDEKINPPIKYNFEYKPEILKKYGPIFKREHIHKYSSKISNICNIIRKSTGIVLIYSQYIDGGIIPVALALEEMGISRYSSASEYNKSLFKNKIEPIDSITMKSRSEFHDETENFNPAKYIMITGEKGFSPNNPADIKYATNTDNINGQKVKVVLISKSGSEGLDFKNIRQIHILEPWYNMNRIEQIIGRGVRNLSHCGLQFEERNVEIYLHSTLLTNNPELEGGDNTLHNKPNFIITNPEEESADLYLYRLSEKKAIQIGKVSRLLKEISIDCILNIGQTNFTADKLNTIAENQNIKIHLSSYPKSELIPFTIGDKPYTEICDYMSNCSYKCNPDITINKEDIMLDTYNNTFIQTNNNRIMERIRHLFREHHFYTRSTLINSINIIKQYPIEQIFYTLTRLIKNKNEYIIDKYGRVGNLINKGELYIFQPTEMNDENASILERTVPVEYKRKTIYLELPDKIKNEDTPSEKYSQIVYSQLEKEKDSISKQSLSKTIVNNTGYEYLLESIANNLLITQTDQVLTSGEKDWYKHTSKIIEHLMILHQIPREQIDKYIIYHNLDMLLFDDKMVVLQYLYSLPKDKTLSSLEMIIQEYFDEKIMKSSETNLLGIIMNKENNWKLFIQSEKNGTKWIEADSEDFKQFKDGIMKKYHIQKKNINQLIGFISLFKNKEMVFKLRDNELKRNNFGARCDSARKSEIIKMLNSVIGKNIYNETNIEYDYVAFSLCVIIEMIMRYYTDTKHNNKIYFITPEQFSINEIKSFTI